MSAILNFDFQERKQLRFSEVNLYKLHKKGLILHLATTCSLKQGETRTSHGPIQHSLMFGNPIPNLVFKENGVCNTKYYNDALS